MDETPRQHEQTPDGSPPARRLRTVRILKLLVVADLVALLVGAGIWFAVTRDDERAAVDNGGLRGSKPPQGQVVPDLASITGIEPAFPSREQLAGTPVLLVATCMECASGDVIGGALRRLGGRDIPEDTRVEVVVWGGVEAEWRREWQLPDSFRTYVLPDVATEAEARRLLGIRDNGFGFLYDRRGNWRSTFPVQLLLPEDVIHDIEAVG